MEATELNLFVIMPGKIFINYRREDARADALNVYQYLREKFGKHQIFMDIDNIPEGLDFRKVLSERLNECKAMLVIIGSDWIYMRDPDGQRRIDNPNDFVRIEIATALNQEILVIPVLFNGAELPQVDQLPEDLQPLIYRQSVAISHDHFARDIGWLEKQLLSAIGRRFSKLSWVIGAALLFLMMFVIYHLFNEKEKISIGRPNILLPHDRRFLFTEDGIGPFKTDSSVNLSKIREIYHDHTVSLQEYSSEGIPYSNIEIKKGVELILRVEQHQGKIRDIMAFSPKVVDDHGLHVGLLFKDLPLKSKESCFNGVEENSDKVICELDFAPKMQYWFKGGGFGGVDTLTPESEILAMRWLDIR